MAGPVPAAVGLLAVLVLAVAALLAARVPGLAAAGVSPLIPGLLLGMLFGHTGAGRLPEGSARGVRLAASTLLRLGIVLLGFQISAQEILAVGWPGLLVSASIVFSTLLVGAWVGTRWFGLDRETSLLVTAGSAICGAAAVAATEAVLRSAPHKATVALGTVVCFGTASMFIYPLIAHSGWLGLGSTGWALVFGGVIHEVAQVVAAGNALGGEVAETAVVVKMTRVLMLAPALLLVIRLQGASGNAGGKRGQGFHLPWFVLAFIAVVSINSTGWVPATWMSPLRGMGTVLLTMAMVALGIETHVSKVRAAGAAPLLHGLFLCAWLGFCGLWLAWVLT